MLRNVAQRLMARHRLGQGLKKRSHMDKLDWYQLICTLRGRQYKIPIVIEASDVQLLGGLSIAYRTSSATVQ